MRRLIVPGRLPNETLEQWIAKLTLELMQFSNEGVEVVFDDYTVEGYTETRTLDASTASATDVADVLCTLIADIKKRGTYTATGI